MKPNRLIRFDWAIKNLFKKNRELDILQDFLSDLLQRKIFTITLCDAESTKDAPNDKSNRVDVHVTTETGEEILIEVQAYAERDYFSRILYSTSKVITTHIHEGEPYLQIPPIISVNICYFPLGHGQDYLYKGTTNFTGMNYGDTLDLSDSEKKLYLTKAATVSQIYPTYYIIKVDSFEKTIQRPVDEWVYFFKKEEIKDDFHSPGLKKAAKHLNILKLSKAERHAYGVFLDNLRDEKSLALSKEADLQ